MDVAAAQLQLKCDKLEELTANISTFGDGVGSLLTSIEAHSEAISLPNAPRVTLRRGATMATAVVEAAAVAEGAKTKPKRTKSDVRQCLTRLGPRYQGAPHRGHIVTLMNLIKKMPDGAYLNDVTRETGAPPMRCKEYLLALVRSGDLIQSSRKGLLYQLNPARYDSMKIFKDAFTGDEMFSDSFKLKLVDDVVYEIECRMVTVGGETFDIGPLSPPTPLHSISGANASAEGEDGDAGVADERRQVNDVVDAMRLKETGFDKKSFMAYIRGYMKAVKTHLEQKNPERVEPFMTNVQPYIKKVIGHINDFQFWTGESMDSDKGMVALMFYKEDGMTPVLHFFRDGLIEEKC